MVSAGRLRRAQQAISSARPYADKLEELCSRILNEVVQSLGPSKQANLANELAVVNPLLVNRPVVKATLVVVSSDRGLCGAYNANASKGAFKRYQELKQQSEVTLLFVGKKAADFFARKGVRGELIADFWAGKFTTAKSDTVAKRLISDFLSAETDQVEIFFTEFRSALLQIPSAKKVLPFEFDRFVSSETNSTAGADAALPFLYEPAKEKILEAVLPALVKTVAYRCFADSLASEFGSRMTAMDNATRNAGKMISSLTLEANKVRQAAITKELMEIVGGAEALKG